MGHSNMTTNFRYDTKALHDTILKKYSSITSFSNTISKEVGISSAHIQKLIIGIGRPNNKTLTAFSSALGIDSFELLKIWSKENRYDYKKTKQKREAGDKMERTINGDIFNTALKEKGLSQAALGRILGVAPSTIWHWGRGDTVASETNLTKLSALLDVPKEELLKVKEAKAETEADEVNATSDVASTEESTSVKSPLFKEIGNEQNVLKIFEIVNNNILTLANELDKCMRLHETRFEELKNELDEVKTSVDALKTESRPEENAPIVATVIKPKAVTKKEKAEAQPVTDTFDYYRHQINNYITKICNKTPGSTHNQILSNFYSLMTNVYGCSMVQLEKEYVADKGHKAHSTMEYIYHSQMYRSIFMNRIKDEAEKAEKE